MTNESVVCRQFAILADESAEWKIAGLAQLDRVLLALNEFAVGAGVEDSLSVAIFWRPDIAMSSRRSPDFSRMDRLRLTESHGSFQPGACLLSTRLFVDRQGLARLLSMMALPQIDKPIADPAVAWKALSRAFETACRSHAPALTAANSRYLDRLPNVRSCEKDFLRGAGKSQDGFVSRFLNRPISRCVTRQLLRFPIQPTTWTVVIFILPAVAFLFLIRGDYVSLTIGAALFQLYSILDGCDGEIARAKYLESSRGGRIDDFLDMIGSLLFVVGIGLGLSRTQNGLYIWEGLVCAAAILSNEMVLRLGVDKADPAPDGLGGSLYSRHRGMIQNSGLLMIGQKNAWWLIQFTKRDVAIFAFLLLAIAHLGPWILHLWITVSTLTLFLSVRARANRRAPALEPGP